MKPVKTRNARGASAPLHVLGERELAIVIGGINPQPYPPGLNPQPEPPGVR